MKNKIIIILGITTFFLIDVIISFAKQGNVVKSEEQELRAIYISYLEYLNNFNGNSKTINQKKIDKIIDIIKDNNYNNIILHVSPFSDSIYKSSIFPYSYTLTGTEGKNPGFDYLEYFIKKAHLKDIKVHAWINPYRISFDSNMNNISKSNPAYKLKNTTSIYSDKNGTYYNPASEIVKELIVNQVEEIIDNYDVDGIHFDDYFYMQDNIDNYEYNKYLEKHNISKKEFRLNNTNDLIKRVYKTVKNKNNNILFSIAPDGNINNNYIYHYADIKTWLKNDGYVDIIMPQIYYDFKNEYSPFEKVLNNWIKLCKNKSIKIVPILAYYKVGEIDNGAGSGKNEWINDKELINEQINLIKKNNLSGYGVFRYNYIVNK